MKKLIPLFLLCLLASTGMAQNKLFRAKIEQHVDDSTLYIDFWIKSLNGQQFPLAASNFSAFVAKKHLDLNKATLVKSEMGPFSQQADQQHYYPVTLGTAQNFISLNINSKTNATTQPQTLVTPDYQKLGRVSIPINNPQGCSEINWRIDPIAIHHWNFMEIKDQGEYVTPGNCLPLCEQPAQPKLDVLAQSTTICEGEQLGVAAQGQHNIEWYKDGVLLPNAQQDTLWAHSAGTYTAKQATEGCESPASDKVAVHVRGKPAKPSVTQNDSALTTNIGDSVQWFYQGNRIEGATQPSYKPEVSGYYSVKHYNDCGAAASDPVYFEQQGDVTSIQDDLFRDGKLRIYPNPYRDHANIRYTLTERANVKLSVYDLQGRRVATLAKGPQQADTYQYKFSAENRGFTAGTYLLHVTLNGKTTTHKLVEMK